MQRPFKSSILSLIGVLVLSSVAVLAQNGQPANRNAPAKPKDESGGPAPVRSLTGTWIGPGEPVLSTKIPKMTATGQARLKQNIPDPFSATSNDGWKTCDPMGMPRIVNNEIAEIGFSEMSNRIVILENFAKVWREVWMDGRPLPNNIGKKGGPSTMWFGYSVGHWEGDHTLVVETIGMDDKTWVDRRGYPHSAAARAIERYTRMDHNHMTWTETIDDPAYYAEPFLIAKGDYKWIAGQDDRSVPIPWSNEYMCIPSQFMDYLKFLAEPADVDAATGVKTEEKK